MNYRLSQPFSKTLKSIMSIPVAADVLELGYGQGDTLLEIDSKLDRGATLTGIDPQGLPLKGRMQGVKGGLDEPLPFNKESFDFIYGHNTLGRIQNPEKLVKQAAALLRPGGQLFLSEENPESITLSSSYPEHTQELKTRLVEEQGRQAADRIRELSEEAGLTTVRREAWVRIEENPGIESPILAYLLPYQTENTEWLEDLRVRIDEGRAVFSISSYGVLSRKQPQEPATV